MSFAELIRHEKNLIYSHFSEICIREMRKMILHRSVQKHVFRAKRREKQLPGDASDNTRCFSRQLLLSAEKIIFSFF